MLCERVPHFAAEMRSHRRVYRGTNNGMLELTALEIEGAWRIDARPHVDERGSFTRHWCAKTFAAYGLPTEVLQVSQSYNKRRGTLRGMHFQHAPHSECKWVRCTRGRVYDVLLDLRPDRGSFGRWVAVELEASAATQVFIPAGVAHGFLTLTDDAMVHYSITAEYEPTAAGGVRWNDPAFAIHWPFEPSVISDRDAEFPLFDERDPQWQRLTSAA